jgi:phage terminase Nu1 subunit (DNA packaging protein)
MSSSVSLPERELSGPQLAKLLDVKASTVRWWRRNGAPCVIYNEKMIRYRLSEIQAWLRSGKPKEVGA